MVGVAPLKQFITKKTDQQHMSSITRLVNSLPKELQMEDASGEILYEKRENHS